MQESIFQRSDKTEWPFLRQLQERLISRITFHPRQERNNSRKPSNNSQLTMQQCWSTCGTDSSANHSAKLDHRLSCSSCFQPTENPLINRNLTTENNRLGRQASQPILVPDSRPPADSFESGSSCGNGLSPTTTSWTLGVSDFSSNPSSLIDDVEQSSLSDHSSITDRSDQQSRENDLDDIDERDDFEVLSFDAPPESSLFIKEFKHSTSDSQNHVCHCCQIAFDAFVDNSARRCFYYGKLYCSRCHVNDFAPIPAKLITSLDMNLYPVCRRAQMILQSYFYQGIVDIQQDNKSLYRSCPILNEIRCLRQLVQHCYAYLSTCTRLEKDEYEKMFEDFSLRDYLYQSIHVYSISDLLTLKKIQQILEKVFIRAKKHIRQCLICRGKGFTCEICKNRSNILYPFDDGKIIGTCSNCSNIYHRRCWKKIEEDCPKCYRIIQRKYQAKVHQKKNDDDDD